MPFIANTDAQRAEMLAAVGMTAEQLFADFPPELRAKPLNLPPGLCEQEARARLARLSERNAPRLVSFLGGGFYDHYVPAAVDAVTSRSEFYTAYTPYQPEISQGTLQAIYEYQSAICRLTEMEVANASLYDGGTAIYEAIMMALRTTDRNRVIMDPGVNPIYRKMVVSYTGNLGIELVELPMHNGKADRRRIAEALAEPTAAVVLQNPNFFGCLDDVTDIGELAHKAGALLVMSCYPIAMALVKTPGAMGADIVTGEGQSLGIDLSFGGPYLGFMATRTALVRKMPGRICGRTVDAQGRPAFVLTLQAREQHIRREKATSNICSNEGLCALRALVYLSLLGKEGLRRTAQVCADRAFYAQERLLKIPGVSLRFPGNWYFNEFVLQLPERSEVVIRKLLERGIAAGFPLSRYYSGMDNLLLVAVTEKRTKEEIDFFAHALEVSL
jgi:glycine dehydrogenase subunit 1